MASKAVPVTCCRRQRQQGNSSGAHYATSGRQKHRRPCGNRVGALGPRFRAVSSQQLNDNPTEDLGLSPASRSSPAPYLARSSRARRHCRSSDSSKVQRFTYRHMHAAHAKCSIVSHWSINTKRRHTRSLVLASLRASLSRLRGAAAVIIEFI
jgi:hypothetical protein